MEVFDLSKLHPGYPRDQVSCPGCGHEYGAYNRKVCRNCQECSKCCTCKPKDKELIIAAVFVAEINQ